MQFDDHVMFEKYLYSLVEAKMPKGTPRPDVILNRQHTQKTTTKHNPDALEAYGANIGRNTGLTTSQSDTIRDANFVRYISDDMSEGLFLQITGEGSKLPIKSRKIFASLASRNPDNNFFRYVVGGKLVIPYWMVPDCIDTFTSNARTESDPDTKQAYTDALIMMYKSLSEKITYEQVYRNCKPILRFVEEGKPKKVFEVSDTYEEFLPKIINRIKALEGNPKIAILLRTFLIKNHTKPRQQIKFGEERYEDAMFVHSKGSGEHSTFAKKEEEPSHPYDMFDPPLVSTGDNIRDSDLEKIHIKDQEQADRTPTPIASLRAPKPKKKPKNKLKESKSFIENILF